MVPSRPAPRGTSYEITNQPSLQHFDDDLQMKIGSAPHKRPHETDHTKTETDTTKTDNQCEGPRVMLSSFP